MSNIDPRITTRFRRDTGLGEEDIILVARIGSHSHGDPCWMGTSTESFEAAFEDFTTRFKVTR